jgi:hypothetical protein
VFFAEPKYRKPALAAMSNYMNDRGSRRRHVERQDQHQATGSPAGCVLSGHVLNARPDDLSNAASDRQTAIVPDQTQSRGYANSETHSAQLRQHVTLPRLEESVHVQADLLDVHFVHAGVEVFA